MNSQHTMKMFSWLSRWNFALLLLVAISIFTLNAFAALVPVPPINQRVTDLTQTLSAEQSSYLENKLANFEREKGSQIAILLVPSTQPEDISQYSIRVVDAWKLGRANQDDGVLLLVAKDDRKVRIEVGYGLEGAIPDITAKRVIREIISPNFKQGNIFGGLDQATSQIMSLIDGEALPAPDRRASGTASIENLLPLLLIGGMVLGGVFRAIFGSFFGGALTGGAIGFLAWVLGGGLVMAVIFGIVAFFMTIMGLANVGQMGGMGGGGFGGGRSGGFDPFGGGGGGFGGGGASGDW
jgi:uncharacterized protein